MNGAEALLRTLVAGGTGICFANPGTSEMYIMDAIDRVRDVRFVPCLFEGVATGAADGYARMTRAPAATLLHLGPGLANGLANLHNARKARVPMLNIVGEHPSYHRSRDTPLASDIEAIARPCSDWIRTSSCAADLPNDAAEAMAVAMAAPGSIATLMVPADVSWTEGAIPACMPPIQPPLKPAASTIEQAANMLLSGLPTALILGGCALYGKGLALAGRIAERTGAALITPFPLTRVERGTRRASVDRIPYMPEQAIQMLSHFRQFILVDATTPFAYFAASEQDGALLPAGVVPFTLTVPGEGTVAALEDLSAALPAAKDLPRQSVARAALPRGALSLPGLASVIAALLPDGAIVVDEGMTSGRLIMSACGDTCEHDWLGNTGGAIGIAMPLSIGAALACPGRPVLCLSADGSAMYALQALWTIARENLAITTVVFANRAYALLKHEYARVAKGKPARRVIDMFDLDRPNLDWVALAKGLGVSGRRITNLDDFAVALQTGFASKGPTLIEVPL